MQTVPLAYGAVIVSYYGTCYDTKLALELYDTIIIPWHKLCYRYSFLNVAIKSFDDILPSMTHQRAVAWLQFKQMIEGRWDAEDVLK